MRWAHAMQVIQDLHEECGKYGQLVHVIVPRPPNPASAMELFGSNNYGKVPSSLTPHTLILTPNPNLAPAMEIF